ncbi:MAG TPA: hypothetical protein VHG32_26845 [Thermoanaerobaculia bacterium]|nr:hypothetical protein [Thermoanaerobaculia bacterium]
MFVTFLLTLDGLFTLGQHLYKEAGLGITSLVLLAIVLAVVPIVPMLFTSSQLWDLGIFTRPSGRICLTDQRTLTVGYDRKATLAECQHLVFFKPPAADDLRDVFVVSDEYTLEGFKYNSTDSVELKRKLRGRNRLVVFWRPCVPIVTYSDYRHERSWLSPFLYAGNVFYAEYRCVLPTGRFQMVVSTADKVEKAIVFRKPRFRRVSGDLDLIQLAFGGVHDTLAQPQIAATGLETSWEIENPEVGISYVCVFFFEGGEAFWRKEIADYPARRPRSLWSLAIILLPVGLATVWFYRHLYPYLEPRLGTTRANLLAVIPIALAGVYRVLLFLEPRVGRRLPATLLRLARRTPPALKWGLPVILLVALVCTSSVCVTLKSSDSTTTPLMVALERDGKPLVSTVEMSSHEPTWIAFLRPSFTPRRLSLKVEERDSGRKYPVLSRTVALGAAVQLYLPEDLIPRLHLIELAPWLAVIDHLPLASLPREASDPCRDEGQPPVPAAAIRGPSDYRYRLSCRIGKQLYIVDDLRQQAVYIGADRAALSWAIESETPENRSSRLPRPTSANSTSERAVAILSNASPCRLPTVELKGGETLLVSVIAISTHDSRTVLKERSYSVARAPGIQTILLSGNP